MEITFTIVSKDKKYERSCLLTFDEYDWDKATKREVRDQFISVVTEAVKDRQDQQQSVVDFNVKVGSAMQDLFKQANLDRLAS